MNRLWIKIIMYITKFKPIKSNRNEFEDRRTAWINYLKTDFPGRYHLTIKFPYGTSEVICRQILDKFIKQLNQKIYYKRYYNGLSCILGVAVTEYKWEENTYHYHILIKTSEYTDDYQAMKNKIVSQIERIRKSDPIRCIKGYRLQDYVPDELEDYMTKDLWKNRFDSNCGTDDPVGLLGFGSVSFGGLPKKLKASYQLYRGQGSHLDFVV